MGFHLSTCPYCACGCGLVIEEDGRRIVGTHPSVSHVVAQGSLCMRGWNTAEWPHHPDRLTTPLLRQGADLVGVPWQRAVEEIVRRLDAARSPGKPAGILFAIGPTVANEDILAVLRLARHLGARVCPTELAGPPAARRAIHRVMGRGGLPLLPRDLAGSDPIWVFGAGRERSPQLDGGLARAALGGSRVLSFDLYGAGDSSSDDRIAVPPHLFWLLPLLLQRAALRLDRIPPPVKGAAGFSALADFWRPDRTPRLPDHHWLSDERAERLVRSFVEAEHPAAVIGEDWLLHAAATESTVQLLQALAMLGAKERIALICGEANSWGALDLLGAEEESSLLLDLLQEEKPSAITALFVVGDDMVRRSPRPDLLARRISSLATVVVIDTFPGDTTQLAHVVLPGCSFAEVDGTVTSGSGMVQRWRKVVQPPGGSCTEREWTSRIGQRIGLAAGPATPAQWWGALEEEVQRYRGLSEKGDLYTGEHAAGIIIEESTRLSFSAPALPPEPDRVSGYEHLLLFGPSLAQWSTGALSSREGLLRREAIASTVCCAPEDLAAAGLRPGWPVKVVTANGEAVMMPEEDPQLPRGVLVVAPLPGSPASKLRGFFPDSERHALGIQPVPARLEKP